MYCHVKENNMSSIYIQIPLRQGIFLCSSLASISAETILSKSYLTLATCSTTTQQLCSTHNTTHVVHNKRLLWFYFGMCQTTNTYRWKQFLNHSREWLNFKVPIIYKCRLNGETKRITCIAFMISINTSGVASHATLQRCWKISLFWLLFGLQKQH